MKFPYKRRSLRLPEYDYSQANLYFVTICTANRQSLFGQIQDGHINFSEAGRIVIEEWLRTEEIRPLAFGRNVQNLRRNNFFSKSWVIMPPRGLSYKNRKFWRVFSRGPARIMMGFASALPIYRATFGSQEVCQYTTNIASPAFGATSVY